MTHYIHDENNNRIEGMSKEEIYALIDEVIQSGELPSDVPPAFVTALKSIVDGNPYKIGFCTQAEYNQLAAQGELVTDALYIITDDDTAQDIEDAINEINTTLEWVVEHITTGTRVNVTSIGSALNFTDWENSSSGYNDGNPAYDISLTTINDNNQVMILPINSNASIAEARVEYVSGDNGYIEYILKPIGSSNTSYIEFDAYANVSIRGLAYTGGVLRQTVFRVYVKDIYGSEFTQEFTLDYKTLT